MELNRGNDLIQIGQNPRIIRHPFIFYSAVLVDDEDGAFGQAFESGQVFVLNPILGDDLFIVIAQEGEIQPLGSTEVVKVDIRLITATNRNLEKMIQKNEFREDLYYRIRVIPIELPALVERRKDVPLLVNHFANLLATKAGQKVPAITSTAMRALYDYDYPGNVRELRNIIERAFVLCANNTIDVEDLPREVTALSHRQTQDFNSVESDLKDRGMASFDSSNQSPEMQAIVSALNVHGWNRAAAADALDMGRTTLWRKMKKYGII